MRGASSWLFASSESEFFFSLALCKMARVELDALLGAETYRRKQANVILKPTTAIPKKKVGMLCKNMNASISN